MKFVGHLLFSIVITSLSFTPNFVSAQVNVPIPTGTTIELGGILDISASLAGFLLLMGFILAATTIIVSGITYFFAGSNQSRVKAAKDIFKAGIIGSLIIFSAGIIINTVKEFGQNPFNFFE